MALGAYGAAIVDFDQAIQLEPDYAQAYNDRGFAKYKLGAYEAAVVDLNKAIQFKADYAEAYLRRGIANIRLHRINEARMDFQTALRLAKQTNDVELQTVIEKIIQGID